MISDDEISRATTILLAILSKDGTSTKALRFKNISLHEAPKALLLPYLDAEAARVPAHKRPFVPRCVDLIWSTHNESTVKESTISLDTGVEVSRTGPKRGQHGSYDR